MKTDDVNDDYFNVDVTYFHYKLIHKINDESAALILRRLTPSQKLGTVCEKMVFYLICFTFMIGLRQSHQKVYFCCHNLQALLSGYG